MNSSAEIFEIMRTRLHSQEFMQKHSISESDFTRNCKLTFNRIFSIITNLVKQSTGNELDKFYQCFTSPPASRSAFSKARKKMAPSAFIELNDLLVSEFYKKNKINTFHGLIAFAIDGSSKQLPNSGEIIDYFGYSTNQTAFKLPMARSSQLYDSLNEITVHAILGHYNSAERDMAIEHIKYVEKLKAEWKKENICRKCVMIFDRGYPSVALIARLMNVGVDFIMRCNKKFIKQVVDVEKSGKKDEIINVSLSMLSREEKDELKQCFPSIDLNMKITIRVIIIELDTSENEILVTSLIDKKKYPRKIFKEFYFLRWGVETDYGFLKCRAEIENFSGKSVISVKQDFHATILAKNATSLLAHEAKKELDMDPIIQDRKHTYDINFSLAFGKMKNRFVMALMKTDLKLSSFCQEMKVLMKTELEPIRPDRHFERVRAHPGQKFPMNMRGVA